MASEQADEGYREIVHQCPPEGSHIMPCCGKTPFDVPTTHRMTYSRKLVTCGCQPPGEERADG